MPKTAGHPRAWRISSAGISFLAATLVSCGTASAQDNHPIEYVPPPVSKTNTVSEIKKDAALVLVSATVTDPYGRLVTGLDQENFQVYENGQEQEIMRFAEEDVPISIGVIFDLSGSMSDKIAKSRMAAVQFFKTANPADEFFLVDFNDRAELATPFTHSISELQNRLLFSGARGSTALLDAVYLGMTEMKGAHNARKALLIISDGGDNHSRYDEADVKRFVRESDTQIYAIGLYDPVGDRATPEEQNGPGMLRDLTDMTGGRTFNVGEQSLDDLPDIASKISMELRNQYVLGYKPSDKTTDGKWRKIKVKLRPPRGLPPLTVYARNGYYAPNH